ncbi:YdcF family protein [Leptolyngbya sp. FACHB-36]|uniref:YdcF family protein n=1 Tax=Leptolyngbya sp. FACHB-36 TaxID=2692808 RepID=UPI001681B608|nr:YdcF family protein [Leptolyngbya sp. FACHB-36]MBD2022584.1 YdcF family protein [Leptolyngbya sp. FACHB-36]
MIDPKLCQHSASLWYDTRTLFHHGLNNGILPAALLLLLGGLAGAFWFLTRRRSHPYRRPRRSQRNHAWRWAIAVGLSCFFLTTPLAVDLASWALVNVVPSDSGKTADAIVVLGRGTTMRRDRIPATVALWQENRAPRIFVSGYGDAQFIAQQLQQQIPEQVIDGEECSRTTDENAQYTAAILQPQGVKRIVLVTDAPHMLRSLLTFRSFGFDVIPHPTAVALNDRQEARLVFREYFGLIVYGLGGRYFERDSPAAIERQPVAADE